MDTEKAPPPWPVRWSALLGGGYGTEAVDDPGSTLQTRGALAPNVRKNDLGFCERDVGGLDARGTNASLRDCNTIAEFAGA